MATDTATRSVTESRTPEATRVSPEKTGLPPMSCSLSKSIESPWSVAPIRPLAVTGSVVSW